MNITCRRWTIQLNFFWLIVSMLAMGLFYYLGTWQLERYQEKKGWIESQSELTLEGQFLSDFTLYIDNKIRNNIPGYEIFQAFQLKNNTAPSKLVLISRGWVAQPENAQGHYDRSHLPKITLPDLPNLNPIVLKATLIKTTQPKYLTTHLETTITPTQTTIRASRLDMKEIEKTLFKHQPPRHLISTYYLSLPKESVYQLTPLPEIKNWLNPQKHLGYAAQWLLFCLITLFLFLRFGTQLVKTSTEKSSKLCSLKID